MAGPWDKYKKAGDAGGGASAPSDGNVAGPWTKFQPDNWVHDDDLIMQPDLGFLPGPFGPIARAIGYDGVPRPKEEGYEPSSVPVLDPLSTLANHAVEAVPVIGKPIADLGRATEEKVYGEQPGTRTKIEAGNDAQYPNAAIGGDIAGTVLPLAGLGSTTLGGRLLGMRGGLAARMLGGAGSGAVLAGGDAYVRNGGDVQGALRDAGVGALVGGALPLASKAVGSLWGGVKKALSKTANAGLIDDEVSNELGIRARELFRQSEQQGLAVRGDSFGNFVDNVIADSRKGTFKPNPRLDEKASALYDELASVKDELAGGTVSLSDLHELRQIAQKVSMSSDGRDAAFANKIIEQLDDYIDQLGPNDIVGGIDPRAGAQALQDGIATWHAARKAATIEEAIYKAKRAASGFENGLRVQFRSILTNERKRRGFTEDELNSIAEVVDGSVGANLAKLIGKFGFGGGNASNMLGGTIGALGAASLGGPVLGTAAAVGTSGMRALSQKLTSDAAGRTLGTIASKAPVLTSTGAGASGKVKSTMTLNEWATRMGQVKGGQLPLNAPAAGAAVAAERAY